MAEISASLSLSQNCSLFVPIEQEKTGVIRSATQYGLQGKIMDCLGCDMTQHPWRVGGIFDAIVTDRE